MGRSSAAALANEATVTITRVFDAPRALVWAAWTDPKRMAQWWGPKGFTNPVCELDLRVGGKIRIDMRAPDGTRYEETERLAIAALETIAQEVGRDQVAISIGYVGLIPSSYPINAIYQWTGGPEEAILRVAMRPDAKVEIEQLKERLRGELATRLPGVRLSFEPADIVNEVMSFGSPTPVDVAVTGPSLADDRAFA